jgi:hypothetical protein
LACLLACEFPSRSASYRCETSADCATGRTCTDGFCAVAPIDAPSADATDAPSDAMDLAIKCQAAGYTLVPGPDGYYKTETTAANWTSALAACAAHVPGASHLIVLSKVEEVTYMPTTISWVGLSDRTTEGAFVTVTGEIGDQRPWAPGEPNGTGDCIIKEGGQLYDRQCGDSNDYVCECDGRPSE